MTTTKPWLNAYPPGTRWDAPLRTTALTAVLDEAVARWPERTALRFEGAALSYAQLDAACDRFARALARLGVRPGSHVGLYLPNTPHYVIGFFAALRAGATVVNYSPLDAGAVLAHKIEDSRTDLILTLDVPELAGRMRGFLDSTRLATLVLGVVDDFLPAAATARAPADEPDARCFRFAELMAAEAAAEAQGVAGLPVLPTRVADLQALAVLQYTGGTTGHPKGAMLTHANLSSALAQLREIWLHGGLVAEGEERFLVVLPLFHIYSLVANMLLGLSLGAELTLHQRFETQSAVDTIAGQRISVFFGVPTIFVALATHETLTREQLASLKFCNSGGAPIAIESYRRFVDKAQCRLLEGWGMTETCGLGTLSTGYGEHPIGSAGVPVPRADVRFLDLQTGQEVPLGEKGELCIRGPNVMAGYWQRPDATAESCTADGYLRTGDVGYMTRDGVVYLVDRTKDMLICGGFNVYPRNIEEAIYRHPSVEEVIVIGIPDAYRGQSPKAFVKLKAGASPLSLDDLRAFLKDHLGKHEMPSALELREALPKTPVGKLSKKELHAEVAQGAVAVVA
ncbi:AMP-binding protein [Xenophilus arseniciresistens]|uniref:AMP-binding protein n=1 Tax=Xenophilus arseniciresistens TaxID=1283306 RepID=A0AAE3N9U8_9BURK|nr:AMP-binding protein [Xenophilus arseniciresistens]MDA7418330.1 AMP-binding protein [Xenophilus arseniciresistens]